VQLATSRPSDGIKSSHFGNNPNRSLKIKLMHAIWVWATTLSVSKEYQGSRAVGALGPTDLNFVVGIIPDVSQYRNPINPVIFKFEARI